MLSGSTIARAILLLVAAAAAIGLVSAYWPREGERAEAPDVAATQPERPAKVETQPAPSQEAKVEPAEPAPAATASQPEPPSAAATAPPAPEPAREPPPPATAAQEPKPTPASGAPDAGTQADATGPLDLNTATVEALNKLAQRNKLKKPATFGPTIVKHRPYKSVDELVKKKIINKAKYDRIKDGVAVR